MYLNWFGVVVDDIPLLHEFLKDETRTESDVRKTLLDGTFGPESFDEVAWKEYLSTREVSVFPEAQEALQELKTFGAKIIAVGVTQEVVTAADLASYFDGFVALSFDPEAPSSHNDEVIYVGRGLTQCKRVYDKVAGVKVLSVTHLPESMFSSLELCSIVCNTLKNVSEYVTKPYPVEEKRLTYAMSGFSTGIPKFYFHKLLRGWRIVSKATNVTYLHQEMLPSLTYDSQWYGTKCLVKNLVKDYVLKKLTDKLKLVDTMKDYHRDHRSFLPESWSLSEVRSIRRDEILIVKPTTAARGEGITVVTNNDELDTAKALIDSKYKGAGVACTYIRNPYLFCPPGTERGLKFHFRSYLLFTSSGNFHTFNRSKILTAADPYKQDDYSNKRIHDSHGDTTETDFFYPEDIPEKDRDKVKKGIESIMERLIKVLDRKVEKYEESLHAYQILGPDIMFDANLNPWLIEVNLRPQLAPMNKVTDRHRKFQEEFFKWEFEKGVLPFLPKKRKASDEIDEEPRAKKSRPETERPKSIVYISWNVLFRKTTAKEEPKENNDQQQQQQQQLGLQLDEHAVEALTDLKGNQCKVVVVGEVDRDVFDKERDSLPSHLVDEFRVRTNLRDLERSNGEVFFIGATVRECEDAERRLENEDQKILSVALDMNTAKELAHVSITCRSLLEVSDFIGTKPDPRNQGKKYIIGGFSGIQKLELHKLLRGCIFAKYDKRVDLVHQEFDVQKNSWDKSLWGVRCTVKNNVDGNLLKRVTEKHDLYLTMKRQYADYKTFMPASYSFEEFNHVDPGKVVIVKPVGGKAFGGAGISIATNDEELRAAKDLITSNRDWRNGVICEYIRNPLLFRTDENREEGRKFHFRTYLMCTSWGEFHTFPRCRMLTAGCDYEDGNFQDKLKHDTHVGTTELDYFFPDDYKPVEDRVVIQQGLDKIHEKIIGALNGYVKSYKESDHGYQILASDILFDAEMNPWLLEVNTQPGFNRKKDTQPFEDFQKEFLRWEFKHGIEPKLYAKKN